MDPIVTLVVKADDDATSDCVVVVVVEVVFVIEFRPPRRSGDT